MLDKAALHGDHASNVAEGTEGSLNLGPERPRVYSDLSQDEKDRCFGRIGIIIEDVKHNCMMTLTLWIQCQKIQWNSNIVNNMLPVLGLDLVTATQVITNEKKDYFERLTQQTVDPLALMSNVSPQHYHSQSSTNPPTTYHQPHSADTSQSDLGLSPTDNLIENLTNTLALLTQSYKTFLPQTNNQLRTSSNPRNQATVQDGRVVVQNVQGQQNRGQGQARQVKCYNCNGVGHIARNCTQPKRPQNSEYFKDKMLLMQAQENGVVLDEEQLLFLAGGQDNAIDEDVDEQPVQDLALNVDNVFQADDYPVYDEAGPSYDSDVLSEVHDHDHYQDAVSIIRRTQIHDDDNQTIVDIT
ncbi:reverse transcriptase domain-containing protein [Tanacetum coccineum]|uniref:Reverse transcriptase domain-containing protein n=1 Tax=Tanacetum coccineum TaxID=301880 RepID=A0ABQ4ZAI3_9ASTR